MPKRPSLQKQIDALSARIDVIETPKQGMPNPVTIVSGTAVVSNPLTDGSHNPDGSAIGPKPVPSHWEVGLLVRRKGTAQEARPIYGKNEHSGQITTDVYDQDDGWKRGSWNWELFNLVDAGGNVIPEPV